MPLDPIRQVTLLSRSCSHAAGAPGHRRRVGGPEGPGHRRSRAAPRSSRSATRSALPPPPRCTGSVAMAGRCSARCSSTSGTGPASPRCRRRSPADFIEQLPWRAELELWEPWLTPTLPEGLRAPELHAIVEMHDERAAVWMEDVDEAPCRLDAGPLRARGVPARPLERAHHRTRGARPVDAAPGLRAADVRRERRRLPGSDAARRRRALGTPLAGRARRPARGAARAGRRHPGDAGPDGPVRCSACRTATPARRTCWCPPRTPTPSSSSTSRSGRRTRSGSTSASSWWG